MKHEALLITLENVVTKLNNALDDLDELPNDQNGITKHHLETMLMMATIELNTVIDNIHDQGTIFEKEI